MSISMDMRNVKNANYLQVNEEIKRIMGRKGIEVLSSSEAWKKYKWSRKYYKKKPKNGFFVWVKRDSPYPITTCVRIQGKDVKQQLNNLVVLEEGVKSRAVTVCGSSLISSGLHTAGGKIVLKEGAVLEIMNLHSWSPKINVHLKYEYVLEKNSKVIYNFKMIRTPNTFTSSLKFVLKENSTLREKTIIDNKMNSKVVRNLKIILEGENSDAISRLRAIGRDSSTLISNALAVGKNYSKAHLDCRGLIIGKNAKMKLIPALFIKDKRALLTHEASIGRIAGEQLDYLRTRGLSEDEAIELIVSGFLKI